MNYEEALKAAIKLSEAMYGCATSLEQNDINQNYTKYDNYQTIVKNQKVIESISSLDKKIVKNTIKKYDKNIKNYFL